MTYTFQTTGTCSKAMHLELDEQNRVHNLKVDFGCDGNLKGLSALVEGMEAQEIIRRLRGIECKTKGTSCPDQLAQGLERILAGEN